LPRAPVASDGWEPADERIALAGAVLVEPPDRRGAERLAPILDEPQLRPGVPSEPGVREADLVVPDVAVRSPQEAVSSCSCSAGRSLVARILRDP
jgi:hypothetical protein